ncbi:hypothetical protein MCHI_001189 [Candidatus Magnetoovum chiemensis]|nr:hypothetical protein MCHI_001189 [Candidatus Magnetoovum chiemensis]
MYLAWCRRCSAPCPRSTNAAWACGMPSGRPCLKSAAWCPVPCIRRC